MADSKKLIVNNVLSKMKLFEFTPPVSYIWEDARLKSLEKWPLTRPSAQVMAEAGFYCPDTDLPGTVSCFSCFIELDGWEPSDKPWEEHKKRAFTLNPACKFIEIGKKESDFTVNDFLEIQKSVTMRILKEKCEKGLNTALALHKKKKSSLKKDLVKFGVSLK